MEANEETKSPLAKPLDKTEAAWNIVKSVGPILISQSDRASQAFARHKARLASVEAAKELVIDEGKKLNDVKKQLLEKYAQADTTERVRIAQDLEYVAASLRQFGITEKALLYLPEPAKQAEAAKPTPEISPHWMDKFNELARTRNEDWRAELLARALATEAGTPGSVSPRALWLIGTLEEQLFRAFACILDICSHIEGYLLIPQGKSGWLEHVIPECPLGSDFTIGHLAFMLADIDVLGDINTATRTLLKGYKTIASYFGKAYIIVLKQAKHNVTGIIPTGLGQSIARFCQRNYNPLGEQLFEEWIESLDKDKFDVREVPSGSNAPGVAEPPRDKNS